MTAQPSIRSGEQAWLEHDHETGYVELIGGELIVAGGGTPTHQRMVSRYEALLNCVKPDGEVFIAPLGVKLADDYIPEPDVFWVSASNPMQEDGLRLIGVPDLIIEIVSPTSQRRDRCDKFRLYERVGVKEYWISDSETYITEVYVLENKKYALVGKYAPEESFESPLLRQTIDLKAVFAALPLPVEPADP
jgi:Uma2 family endonuclease